MSANLTSNGYLIDSLETLQQVVPAAFAKSQHPDRSDKYSFFSTAELLNIVEPLGWTPYSGKQYGNKDYSRHIIRLNNSKMGFQNFGGDKIRPQILIDNSHDGYTKAQIHIGLFRLVCSNGLVVGMPGQHTSIKFRHMGINPEEIIQLIEQSSVHFDNIGEHIQEMTEVKMDKESKVQFAVQALAYREPTRFMKEGQVDFKAVTKALNPETFVTPLRSEDKADNLWNVFNIIQEKTVKGLYDRKIESGKIVKVKPITNAVRSLEYNKKLWTLAESFMS